MIWISTIISLIVGISLGGYLQKRLTQRLIKLKELQQKLKITNKFVEIFHKVNDGDAEFKSRLNESIYLTLFLSEHGPVDLIYISDKNDLAVFQNSKVLYTTEDVDRQIVGDIIGAIYKNFHHQINDVVEVLGLVFYRKDFEKSFNMKFEDLKKMNLFNQVSDITEAEIINAENQKKFDIDEILDKISAFGINILSPEEKSFLDNYGKKD